MTKSPHAAADLFGAIFPPRRIRVLGAGRFGRLAAERLKGRFPESTLSVTDSDARRVSEISAELEIAGEVDECIASLGRAELEDDLWLVPSVPVHVAFEWVLNELGRSGNPQRLPVPEEVDAQVPNPIRAFSGTLYTSFATFLCPDYCSEPDEVCTYTGKKRPGNLFEVLGGVDVPGFAVTVLRSFQLAPGVGGYPVRSLRRLAAEIGVKPGGWLVATSCRCHAVINGLEWGAK